MDISFKTNKLAKQMHDDAALKRHFGDRAKPLKLRLRVLAVAPTLAAVPVTPPDRCHQMSGDRAGQVAVMLTGNWRLIFEPNHDPVPCLPDGGLELAAVTAIRILEVVDYH